MRIHLKTLGCRLNEAELETWAREFRARGHRITNEMEAADVVVVNTCAVTGEAVRKSRKLMHRVHRANPLAKLVVSGCHATLELASESRVEGVDLVVENRDKERLVEIATRELDLHAMPASATLPGEHSLLGRGRQRAFIKVQDGCRYQCTFCIVTLARGDERSKPVAEVVEEVNRLHREGVQELVLTGVQVGGYGSDSGSSLAELIGAVLERTEIPRLRLGAVEPWDLPERFWSLFANRRFMPHLHLPLQSGADSVLKRMARRCRRSEFLQMVAEARRSIPDFNVTTDIIVGFPGETEAEWQQTLETVEQATFGHLHIFAYSSRPGTRAATLPDSLPREVIKRRSEELHRLGERLKRATLESYVGRRFPVLIEGAEDSGNGIHQGYTPNFLRVTLPAANDVQVNHILPVRLTGVAASGDSLLAEIE